MSRPRNTIGCWLVAIAIATTFTGMPAWAGQTSSSTGSSTESDHESGHESSPGSRMTNRMTNRRTTFDAETDTQPDPWVELAMDKLTEDGDPINGVNTVERPGTLRVWIETMRSRISRHLRALR